MQRLQRRAYQERAARDAYSSTRRKVLVVSPGGSGKTIIIARIVQLARKQKKTVLIISHRREIVVQTKKLLARLKEKPAILMSTETTANGPMPVTIASVATIMSRGIPEADVLIIDECHRSAAKTYLKVVRRFDRDKKRIIGLSATPHRLDGQAMGNIFDRMIEAAKPSDLLGKYIAKPIMVSGDPKQLPELDKTDWKTGKDYNTVDLAALVTKDGLIGDIVHEAKKRLGRRRAILFAVSVKHSKLLTKRLKMAGFKAVHVDGGMKTADRDKIRDDFEKGKYQILCNCELLNEGWDMPTCDAVIMCRPTRSETLYLQQAARCMRTGGKYKRPLIQDHAWMYASFGDPDKDRDWSLKGTGLLPPKKFNPISMCPKGHLNPASATKCRVCGVKLSKKHRVLVPFERLAMRMKRMTKKRIAELKAWAEENGKGPAWLKEELAKPSVTAFVSSV